MFSFLVKRLVSGVLVVAIVSMAVYALFWYGPRSPALELCRRDTNNRCGVTSEVLKQYERDLGYDNPIWSEYGKWAKGLFTGREINAGSVQVDCHAPCLGISFRDKNLVWSEFKTRFPVTLSIAVGSGILYLVVGVGMGVLAARRRGTWFDKSLVSLSLIFSSIPFYLVALLAMLLLTLSTSFFPAPAYASPFHDPAHWFTGMLLVWLVLGIYGSTSYTRYSRGAMVEALSEDYVRTAKAKGLSNRTVVLKHALRAALVPVITIFGIDFAFLLSGTIFAEKIFSLEGIGVWGLEAVQIKDLPVVQATSVILAVIIVIANILVDIAYSWLDPRVRITS